MYRIASWDIKNEIRLPRWTTCGSLHVTVPGLIVVCCVASKSAGHGGCRCCLGSDFPQNRLRADHAHKDMQLGCSNQGLDQKKKTAASYDLFRLLTFTLRKVCEWQIKWVVSKNCPTSKQSVQRTSWSTHSTPTNCPFCSVKQQSASPFTTQASPGNPTHQLHASSPHLLTVNAHAITLSSEFDF